MQTLKWLQGGGRAGSGTVRSLRGPSFPSAARSVGCQVALNCEKVLAPLVNQSRHFCGYRSSQRYRDFLTLGPDLPRNASFDQSCDRSCDHGVRRADGAQGGKQTFPVSSISRHTVLGSHPSSGWKRDAS
jgi:hypothetical protein